MEVTYTTQLITPEHDDMYDDEIDLIKKGDIPFIPTIGMSIRPNRSDDFMVIEDVFYCAETNYLEVQLSALHGKLETMVKNGWIAQDQLINYSLSSLSGSGGRKT